MFGTHLLQSKADKLPKHFLCGTCNNYYYPFHDRHPNYGLNICLNIHFCVDRVVWNWCSRFWTLSSVPIMGHSAKCLFVYFIYMAIYHLSVDNAGFSPDYHTSPNATLRVFLMILMATARRRSSLTRAGRKKHRRRRSAICVWAQWIIWGWKDQSLCDICSSYVSYVPMFGAITGPWLCLNMEDSPRILCCHETADKACAI